MKRSSNSVGPRIKDLVDLVANDAADPHKVLEKGFEWQHLRELEVAKWSLAAASGLIAAVAVASVKGPPPVHTVPSQPVQLDPWREVLDVVATWSAVIALGAGILLTIGIAALGAASRTQRQYVGAQGLLARLISIGPFLKRAGEQIDLNA